MEGTAHSITAILVNYRSAAETLLAVNGLLSSSERGRLSILVVENGSGGDDRERLARELPEGARLIVSAANLGFAGGVGLAMAEARGGLILVLNPDARLEPGALERMIEFLSAAPRAGAVGPAFRERDGKLLSSGRRLLTPWRMLGLQLGLWAVVMPVPDPPVPFRVDWLVGACMLFRREALDQAAGFDDRYFLYFEEADLCRRLVALGWELWSLPAAVCFHDHAPSAARSGEVLLGREILRHYIPSRRLYLVRFHGRAAAFLVDAGSVLIATVSWLRNSLMRRRPRSAHRRGRAALILAEYARSLFGRRQSPGSRDLR